MWALILTIWMSAALAWSTGGCSHSGDASVGSTGIQEAGGSAGAPSGAGGSGHAGAGAGGMDEGGGGDAPGGGGAGAGGSAGKDGGVVIADATTMPDAVETDSWCAPALDDPKLEQSACCNDLPCNGLCYAADGGALSCECFGLVGGCPAGKVCCSSKMGCTDPLYCGGK